MKRLLVFLGIVALAAITLSSCQTLFGRGHGPVDSFSFLPEHNPGLSRPVHGRIVESANPKLIEVVVPPGTDLSHLVATFSFNTEATISVISSGRNVAQVNSQTANNFESPVLYSIKTPKDKQPWTYRVMVRHADQNALLARVRVVNGSPLEPNFNPNTTAYTSTVPYASTRVTIEAAAQSPHVEKVTIAGHEVRGPRASVAVPFAGVNSLNVSITAVAEDQTTTSHYTVTVVRGKPNRNSKLASLSVEHENLNPAFSPEHMHYFLEVPYPATSIAIKATPQNRFATVALKRATAREGLVALESQGNPATGRGARVDFTRRNEMNMVVEVTAQDGSTSHYTLAVRRAAPDHNNLLSELQVPESTFSPQFNPNRLRYNVEVPYAASQFRVVAIPESTVASAALEGARTTGDLNSPKGATVGFAGTGSLSLSVRVTAQDGSTRTYLLNVHRGHPDRNSRLAALLVNPGTMSPSFSPNIVSYGAVIPGTAAAANITVQTESPYATVTVSTPGVSKSGSSANGIVFTVPVKPAQTRPVDLLVTAQDGSQRIYHVNVTREAAPPAPAPKEHNSRLSGIVVGGAHLEPAFSSSRRDYTVNVPTSQNRVSLFPIAESPKARVTVDGKPIGRAAETIQLTPGSPRVVVIQVSAEDGSASRYTVTITRERPHASSERQGGQPSQPGAARPSEPSSPRPTQQSDTGRQSAAPAPAPGGTGQGEAAHVIQATLRVTSDGVRMDPHVWKEIRDANDQIGREAIVTVRIQGTQRVLFRGTVPVQIRQPGNSPPEISLSWQSEPLAIPADQQLAIDVAIPTQRGRFVRAAEVVNPQGQITVSPSKWSYDSTE